MALNQRQPGTLSSNTIQNLKNDGHCLAITTRSGKSTTNPSIHTDNGKKDELVVVDEEVEMEPGNLAVDNSITKEVESEKR